MMALRKPHLTVSAKLGFLRQIGKIDHPNLSVEKTVNQQHISQRPAAVASYHKGMVEAGRSSPLLLVANRYRCRRLTLTHQI